MTVSNLNFENSYTTDGVTSAYSFTFAITDTDQVEVFLDGVLQDNGFIVARSLVTVGGTVTFDSPPTTGQTLLLYRNSDLLQEDSLSDNEQLPPATIEDMIDKLTIVAQQLQKQIDNAIVFPPTDPVTFNPNNQANWLLGMDSTNTILEFLNPVTVFQNAFPNAGAGNVVGPSSSTVGHLAAFNSTNGQLLEDSGIPLADVYSTLNPPPGNVPLFGTVNPNGVVTGTLGQSYYDTTNVVEYICTTAGNNHWLRLSLPTGTIVDLAAGSAIPAGWILANGVTQGGITPPNILGMLRQGCNPTGTTGGGNSNGYDTGGTVTPGTNIGSATASLAHTHTYSPTLNQSLTTASPGANSGYLNSGSSVSGGNTGSALGSVSTQPASVATIPIYKL